MYYYHHQNYFYYNQNDTYRRHHPYQNPRYNRHQNPSYHNQNYAYHRHQNPSYYNQNYANLHQNPSYYHQNYAYHRRRHPSYHDQNYTYHRHQHHHHSPSYDQIPHHHHHHYHHHQQHHRNPFYDQIEALHSATSNPTRLLVAKVKPKAKAPVVDFPVDVLILILARLPAKTLQKFRCVSKSWNSLILQDHHFISLHQLHLKNNNKKLSPLVTFRREGFYGILNYSSSSSDSIPYEIESNQFKDPPQFITNSCNGLLGLYSSYSFFIVNPTIRKLRPLPRTTHPCYLTSAALGFDASTGVYKVVRIFERGYEGIVPITFGCEVYYLGGRGGWKLIDDPPVQPSYGSLPAVVDGAILWPSETDRNNHPEVVALSFDPREEKFSVILHPEGSSRGIQYCCESHVFASGGCICVAEERGSPADTSVHMNIWLLMKDDKKNNSNKWVKQCVVDLTYVLEQMGPYCRAQPLTTDHNGRIVISWGQGRKDYYDPRTGSFDKHELDATYVDVEHVAPYTESMVWPWPRLCGVQ